MKKGWGGKPIQTLENSVTTRKVEPANNVEEHNV